MVKKPYNPVKQQRLMFKPVPNYLWVLLLVVELFLFFCLQFKKS